MSPDTATYVISLPMQTELGTVLDTVTFLPLPWGGTAAQAWLGTNPAGAPLLSIATEWPQIWLRTKEQLTKFEREYVYVRRFSADCALATGTHAFGDVQPGPDPPDATVMTDAGRVGVESTALAIQSRRMIHGLFTDLRRRLQAAESTAFAKLAGHVVYVWFQNPDAPGPPMLPHKRSDVSALDELVSALAAYKPNPDALRTSSAAAERMPELPLADTTAGAKFYAAPLLGGAPGSMLYTLAGFDIALAYTTLITADEAWREIQRLVDEHDKQGVDVLLVTAGGPDSHGNVFPAEELLVNFVLAHPIGLAHAPQHIKSIVLHSWGTGQATSLHPSVEHAFGPLYGSMMPMHHPFAGQATAEDTDSGPGPTDSTR